jgi:hypothetical protein
MIPRGSLCTRHAKAMFQHQKLRSRNHRLAVCHVPMLHVGDEGGSYCLLNANLECRQNLGSDCPGHLKTIVALKISDRVLGGWAHNPIDRPGIIAKCLEPGLNAPRYAREQFNR